MAAAHSLMPTGGASGLPARRRDRCPRAAGAAPSSPPCIFVVLTISGQAVPYLKQKGNAICFPFLRGKCLVCLGRQPVLSDPKPKTLNPKAAQEQARSSPEAARSSPEASHKQPSSPGAAQEQPSSPGAAQYRVISDKFSAWLVKRLLLIPSCVQRLRTEE